jgi:gliding motility-associated-like protein/uncharacterized repeat protein (TIGR01451 family)
MKTALPFRWIRGCLGTIFISALALPRLAAQTPFACEDQFFLTLSANAPSLNEVVIDPQTNAVVFQSINANLAVEVNAAGYRSTDNFIYCVNPYNGRLVRLDANGQAEVLAQLPLNLNNSYFAGDISPDGRYLIIIGTFYPLFDDAYAADLVRIDLEDPNYATTTIPINDEALIFDIAFHPVTGILYGYDSGSQRLLQIDPQTGDFVFNIPASGAPFNTGSLFFDAYGNLFAYGSPSYTAPQNRLYRIDTETGVSTLLFNGPSAESSDGCSCPYTIELTKTVEPKQAFPCSEVEYTFEIVNTSQRLQEGIRLEDELPAGFTFVAVSENPLGGNILSNPGDGFFVLDDVDLPEGRFEIKIIVNTGLVSSGIYRNQAVLKNLPASLGGERLSDNPETPIRDDSTEIVILAFAFDSTIVVTAICEGEESIRLDAQPYAVFASEEVTFTWQDGSTLPYFNATNPGEYAVALALGCDTAYVFYTVKFSSISVFITGEDNPIVGLGDSLLLGTNVFNTEQQTIYQWTDPQPGSLRCPDCPSTWVRPFNDVEYTVKVQNELGCVDSAFIRLTVEKNKNVYFPNVFKPNSDDAANGYFYPFGDSYTLVKSLSVFSRWGELLFQARDIGVNDMFSGWDGTYRGEPMQPGVFTWVAQIAFLDGQQVTYAGDVTLVR